MRTQISMPATNAGLFKGQQPGKETQEELLKPMHRKRSNIEQMEIVVNGPRKDTVCEEIRAVSSTDVNKKGEQRKEEDPVLSPKREDTRKKTEKEISKGKDPKVPVRQESQVNLSALIHQKV